MSVDPYVMALHRRARVRLALCWLLAGSALLLFTPIHAWTPLVGWAPMLTLVVSPLVIALALEPTLLLRMLAVCRHARARRVGLGPPLSWPQTAWWAKAHPMYGLAPGVNRCVGKKHWLRLCIRPQRRWSEGPRAGIG